MALTVEQLERLLRVAQKAIMLQEKRINELEEEVKKIKRGE